MVERELHLEREVWKGKGIVGKKRGKARHPIQPLVTDSYDMVRFKKNAIVTFLLDRGGFDMNALACMDFSKEDREQFAQLIGYSLRGFSELSYVSNRTYNAAAAQLEKAEKK